MKTKGDLLLLYIVLESDRTPASTHYHCMIWFLGTIAAATNNKINKNDKCWETNISM